MKLSVAPHCVVLFACFVLSAPAAIITYDGTQTDGDPATWNDTDNYFDAGTPTNALPTIADDIELDLSKINDGAVLGFDMELNSLTLEGNANSIGGPGGATNVGTNDVIDGNTANGLTFGTGRDVSGTSYHIINETVSPAGNPAIRESFDLATSGQFRVLTLSTSNRSLILNPGEIGSNITSFFLDNENTNGSAIRMASAVPTGIDYEVNGYVETNSGNGFSDDNTITTATRRDTTIRYLVNNANLTRTTDFDLGTGFDTTIEKRRGNTNGSGNITLILTGVISGGAAGVDLAFDPRDDGAVNNITLAGDNTYLSRTVIQGNGAASVTLTGSLAHANLLVEDGRIFDGNGSLTWNIDGTSMGTFDYADIQGLWDITGMTANFDFTLAQPLTDTELIIADYSSTNGSINSGTFANVTGLPTWATLNYDYNGTSQIVLQLAAVPEPSRLLLALAGLSLALLRRRR